MGVGSRDRRLMIQVNHRRQTATRNLGGASESSRESRVGAMRSLNLTLSSSSSYLTTLKFVLFSQMKGTWRPHRGDQSKGDTRTRRLQVAYSCLISNDPHLLPFFDTNIRHWQKNVTFFLIRSRRSATRARHAVGQSTAACTVQYAL